jgi:biotin carboxyl carrier protein
MIVDNHTRTTFSPETPNGETFVAVERIKSEITGKVWKLTAKPGDRVEAEQTIILIESMKMEIPVQAPAGGVLTEILVREGDDISEGQDVAVLDC